MALSGAERFRRYYEKHSDRVLIRQNVPIRRAAKRAYDKARYKRRAK